MKPPRFTLAVDLGYTLAEVSYGRTARERHPSSGRKPEYILMPEAKAVIDQMHDLGVRVILAVNPDAVTFPWLQTLTSWVDQWGLQIGQVEFSVERHRIDADLWLEDDPDTIDLLDQHGKPRIIFDQPWNRHLPGPRARGWAQVPGAIARARLHPVAG